MNLGARASQGRTCNACRARLGASTLRCPWCGAALAAGTAGPAPLHPGNPTDPTQDLRNWDVNRSVIETPVDKSSSQDRTRVHAAGGQPSESPSRTTGIPTHTK